MAAPNYVATAMGVWAVNTASLAVRATYLPGERIASVALSPDGAVLCALDADRAVVAVLDTATGASLGSLAVHPGSWAITRVVS